MKSLLLGSAATVLLVGLAFAQTSPSTGYNATTGGQPTATSPGSSTMPGVAHADNGKAAASGNSNQAVATTTANADQPAKGANSFTESQARQRIQDQGFTNVTGLTKDKDGVWRGTAQKDGKSAGVWLDYKGNVGQS